MSESAANDLLRRLGALEAELVHLRALATENVRDGSGHRLTVPEGSSRRELLRMGAVALGAAAAGLAARPAEAANGDPVLVGGSHTGTTGTHIYSSGTESGFLKAGLGGHFVGPGPGHGVFGYTESEGGAGVLGQAGLEGESTVTMGVWGHSGSPAGIGVRGESHAIGVLGQVEFNTFENNVGAVGVYGINRSFASGSGPGQGGFGVVGHSNKGHGVVGSTGTTGGAAVAGTNNGLAGAYAGVFFGPVVVTGSLVVAGSKSAAVPHPDGSHRLVYCVESPESWFEDFGKGQLECGQADVTIDPNFAAIALLNDYHVFVTGYDDFELRVVERTERGFRVQAKDTTSAGRFSWRVVARRKDVAVERLAKATIPPKPLLPAAPAEPQAEWRHRRGSMSPRA